MTNYTAAQQAQLIEFYQQWTPRVEAFGYENLPAGTHAYYRHGKKFFKEQQAAQLAESKKGTPYTVSEATSLCALYIQHGGDMFAARSDFFAQFPETQHSASSVYMKLSRIRTLDTQWDNDTEWQTDRQLNDILQTMDAARFSN